MSSNTSKTRVLITVMTYPHPSRGYQELICTAGISEQGEWVRLYPIDYRYRPKHQQFRKYQWIEIDLEPHGAGNDDRKESRRPILDSITILGEPLSTKDDWRSRREIIDRLPVYTKLQLENLYSIDKTSLGIVRPVEMLELKIESAEREWKSEWQGILDQFTLFGGKPKHLEKIPYKFSYVFRCEDSINPHFAMIEDWELGVLFLNERERLESEEEAINSVRHNFFEKMFDPSRDTKLFMGTTWPYNTWVVIGVFWPPKVEQEVLELW